MTKQTKKETLAELETVQAELRRNIEESKVLIARSAEFLDRY